MKIQQYLDNINKRYKLGNATEHTFRGDLQQLIEGLAPGIAATNEPKRQSCGAPDYILTKKDIPVGFIEAKDIGDKDLKGEKKTGNKEQFDRYKSSLNNLIFTDYLDFHLYIDGVFKTSVRIAEAKAGKIISLPQNYTAFENLIKDFCSHISQSIKSSKKLAEMMAGKARMLAQVIDKSLTSDEENQEDSTLKEQMAAFKQILIHDIKPKEFADIYAQTIAYGMFAARLHDHTLPTFSRQEAAELIPKSNPFLRKLFGYIAGPDIDERIKWIVDSLADIFRATDVATLLKDFGKSTQTEDPIIHFYETFLSEYDPKLRKARGVWYTPAPIVNFIVRAVDDILKNEFHLKDGLSDTSKVKIKLKNFTKATPDQRSKIKETETEQEVHKVQILDPATGTGTFLAEVVKHIHNRFKGQEGIWSNYVENQLVPRLNGFELLMASYAMAHLKLDLLLTETGYKPKKEQRFKIYLTNSLEESHPDTGTLFANWLSAEANEANQVKRDTPVMCVIGNPPYSGISSNNGEWISKLIDDYKYIDGVHFNERKHWLNDDYVKFIRFGQHFIEKNGSGVLAFINPHGFLDNPTFRGMRWHLLKTFDKIYTLDLHGNSKKKETAIDGSVDQNVFDIMQGVSINIFIKTGSKKENDQAKLFHYDLFGKRELKYDFLNKNSLKSIEFVELKPNKPFLFFVPKNQVGLTKYEKWFKINEIFNLNNVGMVTARDKFCIDDDLAKLKNRINEFADPLMDDATILRTFGLKDTSTFKIAKSRSNIFKEKDLDQYYKRLSYRPFIDKWIFYNTNIVERPIMKVMRNFLAGENLGLLVTKAFQDNTYRHVFITNKISEAIFLSGTTGSNAMNFPLYIYPEDNGQQTIDQENERVPNLNAEIIKTIENNLDLKFHNEKDSTKNSFAPIDVLDYIYSILHNPTYRKKYQEFLKTDFPRIPYPKNSKVFWDLVKFGGELRQIHLLESSKDEKYITKYPVDGNNIVGKLKYDNRKVFINENQYFDKVPEVAWEFDIGGYQPAQKWLKDHKDKELTFEDILYYQKIISALIETDRIMKEIDKIEIE